MSKPEFLEISAMGRSFHLGMLYDARSDKPIPEITLWEEEQIKSNISITKKLSSNTAILTSDSLDEKAKAMKMSAGLKLSFLGGLVSVTGAAEYMLDDKSSVNESRVALQFSCMTRSEVLAVTHMGPFNEQNARVLDASIATHVVAGIEYGADAFLVFSRTDSDSSKMSSVKGELESAVNAIKTRSISGQGKLDASESDKLHRQNISCKFYGDFILPHNPSNYEEAVAVYKALRDMLGENYGNAVAKLVILCPLSVIDGKPERIVREIGAAAMEDASNVLRSLSEFKLAFTDTSSREARECFPWIRDDIDYFEGKLNVYEINFRAELAELLKKIRGNEWEEQALHELLAGHFSSPFSKKSIETWIGRRKQEIHLLQGHLKTLKNDGSPWIKMCLLDTELNTVLYHDHKTKHVLCLELCLLEMVDPFLKAVGAWVDSKQVMPSDNKHLGWFENPEIKRQLRGDIEQFLAFAERNRNPNSTKFVVNLALARGNGSITNTRLHSQEASVDFVLPGKPDKPDVTVAGPTKFVVTWQPPGNAQGNDKLEQNITGYQCSYRPRSLKVDGDWKTCLAGVNYCVELTDVTTRLAYEVNISAITAAGASEGSDVTVSEGKVYPAKRCLLVSLIVTSKDYGNFMASLYGRPIDVKDARLLLFDIDTNEHKMLTVPLSGSSIKPSLRNFVFRNNRIYFLHKQRSRNAILRYDPENNSWSTVVIRPSEISIQADHMDGYATDGKLGDEIDAFAWFDDQLVAFARTKDRVDGRGLIALKRDNFSGFWKTDGELFTNGQGLCYPKYGVPPGPHQLFQLLKIQEGSSDNISYKYIYQTCDPLTYTWTTEAEYIESSRYSSWHCINTIDNQPRVYLFCQNRGEGVIVSIDKLNGSIEEVKLTIPIRGDYYLSAMGIRDGKIFFRADVSGVDSFGRQRVTLTMWQYSLLTNEWKDVWSSPFHATRSYLKADDYSSPGFGRLSFTPAQWSQQ